MTKLRHGAFVPAVEFLLRKTMMRKFVLFAAMAASLAVAACNTIEGAGRDISAAGGAIADTARDAKR